MHILVRCILAIDPDIVDMENWTSDFSKREVNRLQKRGLKASLIEYANGIVLVFLYSQEGLDETVITHGKSESKTEALAQAIKELDSCDRCACGGIITKHHPICVKCGKVAEVKIYVKTQPHLEAAISNAKTSLDRLRSNVTRDVKSLLEEAIEKIKLAIDEIEE